MGVCALDSYDLGHRSTADYSEYSKLTIGIYKYGNSLLIN